MQFAHNGSDKGSIPFGLNLIILNLDILYSLIIVNKIQIL